jgi:hypothetical protein
VITAVHTWITLVRVECKLILTAIGHRERSAMNCPADGSKWQPMAGSSSNLTAKQEQAILALLTQPNIEQAARTADVSIRTLHRWLKDSDFDAAYREARRVAFRQSVARLQHGSSAAVSTLLKVMLELSTPPSTKVRAADSVLNHAAKAIELEDLEARISDLERSAEVSKKGKK